MTKSQSLVPGPGTYAGNYKYVKKSDGTSVFGSAQRDKNTFYDG